MFACNMPRQIPEVESRVLDIEVKDENGASDHQGEVCHCQDWVGDFFSTEIAERDGNLGMAVQALEFARMVATFPSN